VAAYEQSKLYFDDYYGKIIARKITSHKNERLALVALIIILIVCIFL